MTARLNLALTLGAFALAACGENATQPEAAGDLSAAVSSLALPSNSWTAKAPVPGGGGIACCGPLKETAGAAINSAGQRIVYAFGGNFEGHNDQAIFAYNLVTNTWITKKAEFAGSSTNGVGKIGGLLYISGGFTFGGDASGDMQQTLQAYDPAGDRMIRKANMPHQTAFGVTGVINDKLYVLSGDCTDDFPPFDQCQTESDRRLLFRYDPATNTWATLAPSPHSHKLGAGGVINGKFYVVGGPSNNLDAYDPFSNTWTTLAPIPSPRHVAVVMASKLWMVGAFGSNRSTYVYDPVTNRWSKQGLFPTGQSPPFAAVVFPFDGQSHFLTVGGSLPDGTPAPSQLYTR